MTDIAFVCSNRLARGLSEFTWIAGKKKPDLFIADEWRKNISGGNFDYERTSVP